VINETGAADDSVIVVTTSEQPFQRLNDIFA
jgi:hypothetical protein